MKEQDNYGDENKLTTMSKEGTVTYSKYVSDLQFEGYIKARHVSVEPVYRPKNENAGFLNTKKAFFTSQSLY
jgi:hypothetical protein